MTCTLQSTNLTSLTLAEKSLINCRIHVFFSSFPHLLKKNLKLHERKRKKTHIPLSSNFKYWFSSDWFQRASSACLLPGCPAFSHCGPSGKCHTVWCSDANGQGCPHLTWLRAEQISMLAYLQPIPALFPHHLVNSCSECSF